MAIFLAALAGFCGVMQAGMNKIIAQQWGFSSALLINGVSFLIFNLILFGAVLIQPQLFPAEFLIQGRFAEMKLWWILPGFLGFLLVTSIAIALGKIGAVQAFVICISAQMIFGLAWDVMIEGKAATTARVLGAALTVVGAVIASR